MHWSSWRNWICSLRFFQLEFKDRLVFNLQPECDAPTFKTNIYFKSFFFKIDFFVCDCCCSGCVFYCVVGFNMGLSFQHIFSSLSVFGLSGFLIGLFSAVFPAWADHNRALSSNSWTTVVWWEGSSNVEDRKPCQVPGHAFVSIAINNLPNLPQAVAISIYCQMPAHNVSFLSVWESRFISKLGCMSTQLLNLNYCDDLVN